LQLFQQMLTADDSCADVYLMALPSLSGTKCTVIDNKTANINDKNCSLSIMLIAIDR